VLSRRRKKGRKSLLREASVEVRRRLTPAIPRASRLTRDGISRQYVCRGSECAPPARVRYLASPLLQCAHCVIVPRYGHTAVDRNVVKRRLRDLARRNCCRRLRHSIGDSRRAPARMPPATTRYVLRYGRPHRNCQAWASGRRSETAVDPLRTRIPVVLSPHFRRRCRYIPTCSTMPSKRSEARRFAWWMASRGSALHGVIRPPRRLRPVPDESTQLTDGISASFSPLPCRGGRRGHAPAVPARQDRAGACCRSQARYPG